MISDIVSEIIKKTLMRVKLKLNINSYIRANGVIISIVMM